MSGRPNPTQAREVRILAAQIDENQVTRNSLFQRIAEDKANLERIDYELRQSREQLWKLMTSMDLVASGNNGYESRMLHFLTLIVRG